VGAVDCGTNSIRLLVADLDGDVKTDVHREMRVVRLGQGVDRTGELAPEALERTRLALVDHAATLRDLGAERVRMVATSATRDARNRDDFRDGARRARRAAGGRQRRRGGGAVVRRRDPRARPRRRARSSSWTSAAAPPSSCSGPARPQAALSVDVGLRPPDRAPPARRPADAGAGRGAPRPTSTRRSSGSARSCRSSGPHRRRAGRVGHDRRRARLGLEAYDPERIHLSRIRRPTSPTCARGCSP
jgi:exopolyphosphatase/guanosine-5'-triphosphate,3'-diphosphate pyrophosphatase